MYVCIILMFVAWKKKTWYRSKLKTGGPEIEVLVKSNHSCWIPLILHLVPNKELVMTNIAIENGPFRVDLPIKDGDFL